MAKISVFPLSIGGVQAPLNLLSQVLTPDTYKNWVYPLDLATNPMYGHAIQFTVCDYDYTNINSALQSVGNQVQNLANNPSAVAASVQSSLKSSGGNNFASFLQNTVPQYAPKNITSGKENSIASISLYMPDTLYTSYDSDYTSVSLTETFGLGGYLASALTDKQVVDAILAKNPGKDVTNLLATGFGKSVAAAAGGAVAGLAGGNRGAATSLLQQAFGVVPNPQLQLLYKGIGLREFQFEFTFTPASQKEAEEVDQIIKTFTYYSLPQLTDSMGGQFFIPPQLFQIKFAFLGDSGAAGQIYDIFKNSLTNLVGNQFTKILSGSNPTGDIANAKDAKVFHINDCVLKDIAVNYAPNGWATYTDGYPVQTTISLTFGEINLVNKNTMKASGDAPRTIVTPANPIPGPINSLFPGGSKTLTDIAGKLPVGVP